MRQPISGNLHEGIERLDKALAASANEPSSRFFQLATVGQQGKPQNRTVVFRGMEKTPFSLFLVSDTESKKVADIAFNHHVSVCWYFEASREQFVISGTAKVYQPHQNSNEHSKCVYYWQSLSQRAKAEYHGVVLKADTNDIGDIDRLPDNFCVIGIQVQMIDYLDLYAEPNLSVLFQDPDTAK